MNWLDFGGQRSLWSHKHIFGHNLIIHTVFTTEIDIRMSNRIKCQRLNALWRHKILIINVLAIIHHHSSGDDHDTVTLVWIFLYDFTNTSLLIWWVRRVESPHWSQAVLLGGEPSAKHDTNSSLWNVALTIYKHAWRELYCVWEHLESILQQSGRGNNVSQLLSEAYSVTWRLVLTHTSCRYY